MKKAFEVLVADIIARKTQTVKLFARDLADASRKAKLASGLPTVVRVLPITQ